MLQDKEEYWYGFPAYDHKGMKIGKFNHLREAIDPDKQDKQVNAADEEVRCKSHHTACNCCVISHDCMLRTGKATCQSHMQPHSVAMLHCMLCPSIPTC